MALWTNPPIPFVGDTGRSEPFVNRACELDIVTERAIPAESALAVDPCSEANEGETRRWPSSAAISDLRSGLVLLEDEMAE